MTDVKQYTGLHKERFDEEGRGRGLEGRKYWVEGKGWVGNYLTEDNKDKFEK